MAGICVGREDRRGRGHPSGRVQLRRLLHHLGELFDEQRHAARAVVNLLDERVRQRRPDFFRINSPTWRRVSRFRARLVW